MADIQAETSSDPTELLALGRRHLAVKDYSSAADTLESACKLLDKEHGPMADPCAEAYFWYGKALLGLSREERGVFGEEVTGNDKEVEEEEDEEDLEENDDAEQNGEAEAAENSEADPKENGEKEKMEPESTSTEDGPGSSKSQDSVEKTGTSNGNTNEESEVDLENEDDLDNLGLAWEVLEVSRKIVQRRMEGGGGTEARALLADVHLALGEVALESATYDKAVVEMQRCLELQKEMYGADDRCIAETHYQIGLANSLASNFEEAITHYKNAANILETRIKILENPTAAANDATVKKYSQDPSFSIDGEIKELKELLPEIQERIQDMMDYKAETSKKLRELLCPSNGATTNGAGSSKESTTSSTQSDKPVSNISHLIKRKRKASDSDEASAAKKANT